MHTTAVFTAATFLVALGALAATTLAAAFPRSTQTEVRAPLGTGFTYQGRIEIDGLPYTGGCGLRFTLWDAAAAGTTVGSQQTLASTATNGTFSVVLNSTNQFGAGAFSGQARWIETEARCPNTGTYVSLGRTQITPVPYATFAMDAGDSAELGGFPAAEYARYSKVVVVRAEGTAAENGEALTAALGAIVDATPSAPYLLLLEPGQYAMTGTVVMKPNVDISGFSRATSVLSSGADAVLELTPGATVTNLSIESGSVGGTAIVASDGVNRLRSVTVQSGRTGIFIPAPATFSSVRLEDVTLQVLCASGTCQGISAKGSSTVSATDSTIEVLGYEGSDQTFGIETVSGFITLAGTSVAVTGATNTVITGVTSTGAGGLIRATDSSINVLGTASSSATAVSATGAGAELTRTVISSYLPTATATGVISAGTVTAKSITVTATGTTRYGVVILAAAGSSFIEYSTISTSGSGSGSPALQTNGTATISHSKLTSASASPTIFVQAGSAMVRHSELHGGAAFSAGTLSCAATVDEGNVFYAGNPCP